MAKGKSSSNKVIVLNTDSNKNRRIKTEINRMTKKMNKLLKREEEGKKGIKKDSARHVALKEYIKNLQGKVK